MTAAGRKLLAAALLALGLSGQAWAQQANMRGAPDAPVPIIVFSAFDCRFCAETRGTLAQIEADYPGKIQLIYKHFPLSQDAAGYLPHEAAQAAAAQGKFWEMHDALFARQGASLDRSSAAALARGLKLDMTRFDDALTAHAGRARIQADIAEAKALKVQATPTFYIDGYKLEGAQSVAVLRTMINHALTVGAPRPSLLDTINQDRKTLPAGDAPLDKIFKR